MNKAISLSSIAVISLCLLFLLYKGFENKTDPLWTEIISLVDEKNNSMLTDQPNKLQNLFLDIHPESLQNASILVSDETNNVTRFSKFDSITRKILEEKKVIILHSSGNGARFLIPKIALFIAEKKSRLLKVSCTRNSEQSIHDELIGHRDALNNFQPGKLLKLIDNCNHNPDKKFVLFLDDINNVSRSSIFGALWENLRSSYKQKTTQISGYDKDISIPNNLYIISTSLEGNFCYVPLTLLDYWKLSPKTPYRLTYDTVELKAFLTLNEKTPLNKSKKEKLIKQLYFFTKSNNLIKEKIGFGATIGSYSRIRNLIKNNNYKEAEDLLLTNISNYTDIKAFTKKDFEDIKYSINHNGKLEDSSAIISFFTKMVDLGIFSELTVGILFAVFSFIGLRHVDYKKDLRFNKLMTEIEDTKQKYLLNKVRYSDAQGKYLAIKDKVNSLIKAQKLHYSQIIYLNDEIKEAKETIDFIQNLGDTSLKFKLFMKIVYSDDDITKEEYDDHIVFLNNNKHEVPENTLSEVKQRLMKLHQKSNLKFGRTTI